MLTTRDSVETQRWLAILGPSKQSNYKQLIRQAAPKRILIALDKLVKYEGLWQDFQFGTAHRWLTMGCHKVGKPF